jgi:type VI secretion system FHA domain protein
MTLTLSILRCPDHAVPETRQVPGGEYSIGRGPENSWVLPDPGRVLSKQHCVLEFRGGFWQLRDTSTNGTFLNNAPEPVGRDQVRPLSDGDRIRVGPFEIEARITDDVRQGAYVPQPVQPYVPPPSASYGMGYAQQTPSGWVPPADPLRDPMAPPPPGADIFSAPLPGLGSATPTQTGQGLAGPLLPSDFDPLAEPLPMPDHAPMTSDAFLVPKATQNPDILPDDWNLGPAPAAPARGADPFASLPDPFADAPPLGAPARRPAAPPPAPAGDPFASLPDPFADAPPQRAAPLPDPFAAPRGAPPAGALGAAADPFASARPAADAFGAMPDPFADGPPPVAPRAAPPSVAAPPAGAFGAVPDPFADAPPSIAAARAAPLPMAEADPFAEPPAARAVLPPAMAPDPFVEPPAAPRPTAPAAEHQAPAPAAQYPAPAAPLQAPAARGQATAPMALPADAAAALDAFLAGAGIRLPPGADPAAALHAAGAAYRAAIGGIRALLIARADVKREFRIEQTMLRAAGNNPVKFAATDEAAMAALLVQPNGPAAVAETADDLTAHQVATIAATQAAARALLARLDPAPIEAADSAGGLFGAREKRLWEGYRKLHADVTAQFEDDFDSAFGKAFARAYEQASRKG